MSKSHPIEPVRAVGHFVNALTNDREIPTTDAVRGFAWRAYLKHSAAFRYYHGVEHPLDLINTLHSEQAVLNKKALENVDFLALKWMIVGHDIIYLLGREKGLSELRSAEETSQAAKECGLSDERVALIKFGINATTSHLVNKTEAGEWYSTVALMIILDLWGLGKPWNEFLSDNNKVWLEFEAMAEPPEFCAGRAKWAREFAANREFIYPPDIVIPSQHRLMERQARENLHQLAMDTGWHTQLTRA